AYRVDGEGGSEIPREAFNGPDLTHFASRHVFAGAILPEFGEDRETALARWLADPPSVMPGSFRLNLPLIGEEIGDLIACLAERPATTIFRRPRSKTGIWSWITTVDHKRIGIMYGYAAFAFFIIGGLEAILLRVQLSQANAEFLTAGAYNALFTMHGTTMIFL